MPPPPNDDEIGIGIVDSTYFKDVEDYVKDLKAVVQRKGSLLDETSDLPISGDD